MGLSKSKTKVEPWGPAKAPILGAVNSLQSTFNQNQPQTQAIASQMSGYLPALGAKAFGENPTLKPAQTYAQNVLGGKYLGDGNPHLNDMVDLTRSNTMDGINATFGANGMDFSSRHATSIGRGLGEAELGLRYGDYNQERDRMQQMTGMAPGLVAAEYAPMETYAQLAGTAAELPYVGSRMLAQGIGGLLSPYQTTTQKQGAGQMLAGLAGSGLAAWAGGGFKGV